MRRDDTIELMARAMCGGDDPDQQIDFYDHIANKPMPSIYWKVHRRSAELGLDGLIAAGLIDAPES